MLEQKKEKWTVLWENLEFQVVILDSFRSWGRKCRARRIRGENEEKAVSGGMRKLRG